ncbi:TRAP transporter small permease [Stella sp.]|uniref:TRAP transporter small permease n=1 Tax=Stella sp. TaxID=2912054 RepID=UPI0035B17AED
MFWRVYDGITTGLLALAGFVMFALAIVNAGMRYFLDQPLIWGEEISRYAMVWGTMLGVALAYRAGQHVAITLLVESLPRAWVMGLRLASHLLSLGTAWVLWRAGSVLVERLGFMAAPSSGIAMGWVYAALPAAAILLTVEVLRLLFADARGLLAGRRA